MSQIVKGLNCHLECPSYAWTVRKSNIDPTQKYSVSSLMGRKYPRRSDEWMNKSCNTDLDNLRIILWMSRV